MDPDPGHFLTKHNFEIFQFILFCFFIQKLDEPFRNEEIFIISLFRFGFGVKFFFAVFD